MIRPGDDQMKQTLILLIIAAVLLTALPVNAGAAGVPEIDLACVEQGEGQYTVTVHFTDIPAQNGVEYAQIRLIGSSGAYRIEEDSLRLLAKGDILLTLRHDPIADSLLVLIEPKTNGLRGIGSGGVFTFTLSRVRETNQDPGFTLEAILILKDGAEQQIDRHIVAELPAEPTQPPTTVPPTMVPPTTVPPTTVPSTTVPSTTVPPTVPPTTAAPTTVPTTAAPTTVPPTVPPTTAAPTTAVPTTAAPTTAAPTTAAPTTVPPTTEAPTTAVPTTVPSTTALPTEPGGEEPPSGQTPWGLILGIVGAMLMGGSAWLIWAKKKKLPPFSAAKEDQDESA
jgi:hypothetical protein